MKGQIIASAAMLGCSALLPDAAIAAINVHGVSTLASLRNCGGATATQDCPGGQRLRPFATDGGIWAKSASSGYVETRAIPQAGSYGEGRAELDGDGLHLPTLHAVSHSTTDARVNGAALGFTGFTYNGPAATPFSLKSTLTVDDSFKSPDNPLLPGGAFVSFYIGIFDAGTFLRDQLDFSTGSITAGPAYDCGQAGLLAYGYGSPSAQGGSFSVSVTTQSCSGQPLILQPGQNIVAYANLSMFTNRGGYLDALHTMTTELDPELGQQAISDLRANLVSAVPEPASWMAMIAGFALAGTAARRRSKPVMATA